MSDFLAPTRSASLLQLLQQSTRVLVGQVLSAMHRRGHGQLRYAHIALLANLAPEGSHLTELAERAGITKQAMGELLRDLEGMGYVERQPDPEDRRAKRIRFTAAGRQGLADAEAIVQQVEAELCESLRQSLGNEGLVALRATLSQLSAEQQ